MKNIFGSKKGLPSLTRVSHFIPLSISKRKIVTKFMLTMCRILEAMEKYMNQCRCRERLHMFIVTPDFIWNRRLDERSAFAKNTMFMRQYKSGINALSSGLRASQSLF